MIGDRGGFVLLLFLALGAVLGYGLTMAFTLLLAWFLG